jgi:signal peptidase
MTPDSPGNERAGLQRLALEMLSEVPGADGLIRITVSGGSMHPALRPGDVILVRPGQAGGLKVGDLATFLTDGGPVTHRLVGESGDAWIAKGDNARRFDAPVPVGRIVGRVVASLRDGIRRDIRTGFRAVLTARLSFFEGRISAWSGPERKRARVIRLVLLPLRMLIKLAALPELSR